MFLEIFFDGEQAGFQIQRVEGGFRQQDIHAGFDERRRLFVICSHELIERDGPIARVVYIRRHGGRAVCRADRAGDEWAGGGGGRPEVKDEG